MTPEDRAMVACLGPPPLGGPEVLVDERKYPDAPHWRFWTTLLGEDDQGLWLGFAPGSTARRATEPTVQLPFAFVVLVPRDDPWLVECYLDHEEVAVYVNIGTVPVRHDDGQRVHQVDLDLDVLLEHDGTVRVDDRDEFDERRLSLGYPDAVVDLAEAATARAVAMLEGDPGCFGEGPWLARLAALLDER